MVGGVAASLFLIAGAAFGAVAAFSVCALWGLSGAAFSAASQGEIIRSAAGDEETVAMAIFSGIFNFGIGTGALLGGSVVDALGVCFVGVAGGIVGVAAFLYCVFVVAPRLVRG